MNKFSKVSLLLAGLFLVATLVAQLILGVWLPVMWAPIAIAIGLAAFALFREGQLVIDFLTMKTTKHGMNMGVLILTVIAGLVAVNFIAVTQDKKFDFTSDRLNSLSEQSEKVVGTLKEPIRLVLLYRGDQVDGRAKRIVQELGGKYEAVSTLFKTETYNALQHPDLAQKYEFNRGSGPIALYVVKGEKFLKVNTPGDMPTEEEVTRTLVRMTKEKKKKIYFTSGHGEHSLDFQPGGEAIGLLKADLEVSYEISRLELFKDAAVPQDANLVVVAGPKQRFLQAESDALRDFAARGGALFFAIDPDSDHGLASLLKVFGLEYANNYVLDPRAMIPGMGTVAALGVDFSRLSDVTQPLKDGYTLFLIASGLSRAPDASKDFAIDELVKSHGQALAVEALVEQPKSRKKGPHVLAMSSKGKLKADAPAEFNVIAVGDSDFLVDQFYRNNLNRDFAMNIMSGLAKDTDLITIRPKTPKGTRLEMTQSQLMILLFGFLLPLPLAMLFASGLLWWRRKSA